MTSVLAIYDAGRTSGMAVDSGEIITNFVPVYEGFAFPNAISKNETGGRVLTKYLISLLTEKKYNINNSTKKSKINEIKERYCRVSYDFEKEKEDEKQRILLYQLLNQEEEKELQEVIKQSLEIEEEKRRIAVIEEEELNRALKRSLLDSVRPTNLQEEPKKEETKKEEPKKETKKPIFQIQKNDNFNFENQEKEKEKEEKKEEK